MTEGGDRDPLTGLPHTGAFLAALEARAGGPPYTVGLVDITALRHVNRDHGPAAGDDLLRQVAGRLQASGFAVLVARVGGDKFALLREQASIDGQWLRALRLQVLRHPYRLAGRNVTVDFFLGRRVGPPEPPQNLLWLLERDLHVEKTRELHQRIDAMARLISAAPRDLGEVALLRSELERYRGLARHDPGTGLLNHLGLEERIVDLRPPFAIAFVDIDDLHDINSRGDLWEEGNKAIRGVADRLAEAFGGDNVARWGGDEDMVLAPASTARALAGRLQRILDSCRAELVLSGCPVTFSAGVADCRDGDVAAARLRAERATKRAKQKKGTIEVETG